MSECSKNFPIIRNLDGVYYRAKRNGEWLNLCFSDLTTAEQDAILSDYDAVALRRMCHILCDSLRHIGDELDLRVVDKD